jgi:hypothetical protein
VELDPEVARKTSKARWVVRSVLLALGLGSVGFWAWGKWLAPKSALGGPCSWAVDCDKSAPTCMRESADGPGICSRPCETGVDCAPDVRCISVELDERDEHGVPLKGGYCVPQSYIDERRNKSKKDAGPLASSSAHAAEDSVLPVPHVPGQFEGELTVAMPPAEPHVVWVKGSLTRLAPTPGEKSRTVVDASTGRVFRIDDEKKTFSGLALDAAPGDVAIDKTTEKRAASGVTCDVWRLTEGKARTDVCILQRGAFADPSARVFAPWLKELAARGAIPLEAKRVDSGGKESVRLVVTRIDEHPVDAALFAIPKSYRNLAAKK